MSENVVAIDCETFLITEAEPQPQIVSVQLCDLDGDNYVLHYNEAEPVLRSLLEDQSAYLTAHHAAFDFGCIWKWYPDLRPLVAAAYDSDRVVDTWWNEMLWDIEEGTFRKMGGGRVGKFRDRRFYQYSLGDLAAYHLDWELSKGSDSWRLHYDQLFPLPVEKWPEEAVEYARNDVIATIAVLDERKIHHAAFEETRAAWAFYWLDTIGIQVDGEKVEKLETELTAEYEVLRDQMEAEGFGRWQGPKKEPRRKFVKNTKAIQDAITKAFGGSPPTTDKGNVSTSADTISQVEDAPELGIVPKYVSTQKLLTTYVKALKKVGPDGRIHPRYNPMVETHRSSCGKPNMQNPPRKGGVRECFVPREGYCFVFCDYDALEMRTLAQVCYKLFGDSTLGDALNNGLDPHLAVAAELSNTPYEEALALYQQEDPNISDLRQMCKIANFGYAGGMSYGTFPEYARGYGRIIDESTAKRLYDGWISTWVEMRDYFDWIQAQVGEHSGAITNPITGRVRHATFTEGANFPFQGLAAVGAKKALYEVTRCCLDDEIPAFRDCYPVLFLHDEIGIEAPVERCHDAAQDLQWAMVEAMESLCTDVKITATPVAMWHWQKSAKPAYNEAGKLIPV